jgi:hypothetical protein
LIPKFLKVGSADPLKLAIYTGVAINATPLFAALIVHRHVSQHDLVARRAAGGWKHGRLDFGCAHKLNASLGNLSVYSNPFHLAIPSIMSDNSGPAWSMARAIDGRRLGTLGLKVTGVRTVRPRVGWLYVDIDLADGDDVSTTHLAKAIVSGGGRGVKPWIECRIFPQVSFGNGRVIDARSLGLEAGFIGLAGELIPPGGHLMIDYDSGGQDMTLAELVARVPPVTSYLGELMFRAGFRGQFKDWYFSEGGHEGPRKLQANKSPDSKAERAAIQEHIVALRQFVRRSLPPVRADRELIANAIERARKLIKEFGRSSSRS